MRLTMWLVVWLAVWLQMDLYLEYIDFDMVRDIDPDMVEAKLEAYLRSELRCS